ncbi:hypothetical protein C7C46_08850 [Streptomyces tateyamensis]|uniref:Uncharacterized protein n=1 Tax=Streptomyces tateyamensis TaxID=565073 RepID=A0A2V4NGV1_9ACTN|nr:hypothetical protein [Streptomyces tateyamensis]PYC83433.1 hypothetical protein C7C46_08850 [Streptomyces tateyamensis]
MTDTAARTPWQIAITPDPARPAATDLLETPSLPELAAVLDDPDAEQVLYRVTYERVGRRGGRDGSTPPPPLTTWAMTANHLAEQVCADVRQYLTSSEIDVAVNLDAGRGQIYAGCSNGGRFTVERVATATLEG